MMRKILEIGLQDLDEVKEAIKLDKAQKDGEHFLIVHDGNLSDDNCIAELINNKYEIFTRYNGAYGHRIAFQLKHA